MVRLGGRLSSIAFVCRPLLVACRRSSQSENDRVGLSSNVCLLSSVVFCLLSVVVVVVVVVVIVIVVVGCRWWVVGGRRLVVIVIAVCRRRLSSSFVVCCQPPWRQGVKLQKVGQICFKSLLLRRLVGLSCEELDARPMTSPPDLPTRRLLKISLLYPLLLLSPFQGKSTKPPQSGDCS